VVDLAPPRSEGRVIGAKEAAAGAGAALGPLTGGYIYEQFDPVWAFTLNGLLLLCTALLVLAWFRGKGKGKGKDKSKDKSKDKR
jgi:MFS family permease